MNEHIHPYKGKHSVKEAVISFYVQQNEVAPETFRKLLTEDGPVRNFYQKFEIIKEISVDVSLDKDTKVNRVQDAGFKYTGFNEGRTSKVVQCINQPMQTVFTFNELEYVSWEEYLPISMKVAKQIANLLPGNRLTVFNLLYIDEFYFDEGVSYNAEDLFNLNSRTLPKGLLDSPLVDYHLVLNKKVGDQGYTDSLNIKVLDTNMCKTIRIINSVTYPLAKRVGWLDYLESEEVVNLLNHAHESNKQMLNDILNKNIAKEIRVCVC